MVKSIRRTGRKSTEEKHEKEVSQLRIKKNELKLQSETQLRHSKETKIEKKEQPVLVKKEKNPRRKRAVVILCTKLVRDRQ